MRVLTVHNRYKFRGGEDECFEAENGLLLGRGHEVRSIAFDNTDIRSVRDAIRVGVESSWATASYARVKAVLSDWRPDIVTVHNFFPLASPAVHYAAKRSRVPVVQTLHNFRLVCPGALLFREGDVCEDCLHRALPLAGVVHRCYHGSAWQSAAVALMISAHRLLKTWERTVSLFIAVSEFEKDKFVEAGFRASKILVKPNFVSDTAAGGGGPEFLFVGRLAPEKGVRTLIRAMKTVTAPLNIVGEGPLDGEVRQAAVRNPLIRYLGWRPQQEVLAMMGRARCVVVPSEWYETFGRVAAESFACGTPVIAARIGALEEMVEEGRTGFCFTPGDADDLARVMTSAAAAQDELAPMRRRAREAYERRYTAERNYELLMKAYSTAMATPYT